MTPPWSFLTVSPCFTQACAGGDAQDEPSRVCTVTVHNHFQVAKLDVDEAAQRAGAEPRETDATQRCFAVHARPRPMKRTGTPRFSASPRASAEASRNDPCNQPNEP